MIIYRWNHPSQLDKVGQKAHVMSALMEKDFVLKS